MCGILGLRTLDDPHFMGTAHVTSYRMRTQLFHPEMRSVVEDFEKTAFEKRQEHTGRIRSAAMFDQSMRLPNDLLSRTDRATMALSLEARVPFLDHHLVELSNSLPDEWCLDLIRCQGKKILKRVAARFLPREVIYRAKRGFDLPLEQWLTEKFGQVISEYLEEKLIAPLNYEYLGAICGKPLPKELTASVWSWLVLEHWYRLWILGKASPIEPKIVGNQQAYDLLRESGERERV